MEKFLRPDSFQKNILSCTQHFANVAAKVTGAMLGTVCQPHTAQFIETGVSLEKKFIVSIMFTGTVYGEYIFAIDEAVAGRILGQSELNRADMSDIFCEILNMVVGESVVELNHHFQKLTMTPPRVYFGDVRFPKIKTGHARLQNEYGFIDCYLSIDRMQLDIATSYKDALSSLTIAHNELQAAMNKLQHQQTLLVQNEKLAAFGTIAAGVAHEINTPLTVVSMMGEQMMELMEAPLLDRESLIQKLNTIESTVQRISKITKSLWAFALRMKEDSVTAFTIKELMDDTLVMCDHRLKEIGVKFSRNENFDKVQLEGHMPQISQLMMNILFNACDAIQEKPNKWIHIEFNDLGADLEIRMSDSGTGLSENVQQRLFDPFFTTKNSAKNAGLGMSIAKRIIEKHKGTLYVDKNSPNTCFVICLPKKAQKKAAA